MKLNSKGYSLIELMVSLSLISGVALLISQFSTSYQSGPTNYRRVCESYTESLTSLVKEETPYHQIQNFITQTGARTPPNTFDTTRALLNTQYRQGSAAAYDVGRPASEVAASAASGTRLQSFQLIQGSVRTLAEMYNGGLGCNFAAYPRLAPGPTTLPIPADFAKLPGGGNVIVDFRIEPFRISSGQTLCAQNQAYPAPRGENLNTANGYVTGSGRSDANGDGSGAYAAAHESSRETSVAHNAVQDSLLNATIVSRSGAPIIGDPDLGMRFSVRMRYTVEGQQYSCVTAQDFTYPPDSTPPPVPSLAVSVLAQNTSANDPGEVKIWNQHGQGSLGRPDNNGRAQLQLGYNNQPRENGVQLLCKDLSFIKQRPAGPVKACFNTVGDLTHISNHPHTDTPSHGMNTSLDRTNIQLIGFTDTILRTMTWVPCDMMQQCGVSPSSRSLNSTGNNYIWTLDYTTLPFGCHLDFEVLGVDTAGNRSASTTPRFIDKNTSGGNFVPQDLNPSTSSPLSVDHMVRATEIYYPVCATANNSYYRPGYGTYCTPNSDWNEPVPDAPGGWDEIPEVANGYYTTATTCCYGSTACRPWPL